MGFLLTLIISTASVLLAGYIVPGIYIQDLMTAIIVAIVLGVMNTFIKPIIKILTLPLTILTLGLFALVINVAIIYLVDYIVPGFEIATVWAALFYSIALSLISSFFSKIND